MNVMEAWAQKRHIEVTERETVALVKASSHTRIVALTFGAPPVRLLHRQHSEWAYLELAKLRGEGLMACRGGKPE
jgi:hypothetical protein